MFSSPQIKSKWFALLLSAVLIASSTLAWFAYAAEVTIDNDAGSSYFYHRASSPNVVFITDQVGYAFYADHRTAYEAGYRKTTDGGLTWSNNVDLGLLGGGLYYQTSVWYDQWTPGNTGDTIHIMLQSYNDIYYQTLDTTTDTLTNPTNVTWNQANLAGLHLVSITEGTDGDIYIGSSSSSDSFVVKCASASVACAGGASSEPNWTSAGTNPLDADTSDHVLLMPLFGGNILLIRHDNSASDMDSKVYTDSTNTWDVAWTDIDLSAPQYIDRGIGFGGALNKNNGDIYLAYSAGTAILGGGDDDIRTAIYSSGSWTSKADVVSNEARGITGVKIARDLKGGLHVVYAATDGTVDINNSNIYYRDSTDEMTSWGSEKGPLNSAGAKLSSPSINITSGYRLFATWLLESTLSEIRGNTFFGPADTGVFDAQFTLNAGGLQIVSFPSIESFGSATIGTSATTLGPVTFSGKVEYADLRNTPGSNAYTVYAEVSQFSSSSSTFGYSGNFKMHADGYNPSPPLANVYGDCAASTLAKTTLQTFVGAGTKSDPVPLVVATSTSAANTGLRQCTFKPVVEVTIPALQKTGTYQTSIYWTIL